MNQSPTLSLHTPLNSAPNTPTPSLYPYYPSLDPYYPSPSPYACDRRNLDEDSILSRENSLGIGEADMRHYEDAYIYGNGIESGEGSALGGQSLWSEDADVSYHLLNMRLSDKG